MDFSRRHDGPEIMDGWEPGEFLEQQEVHRDIVRVNRWLGGNRAVYRELERLLVSRGSVSIHLLDAGCGDGDLLRYLRDEFAKSHPNVALRLSGWDFNGHILKRAGEMENNPENPITFQKVDLLHALPAESFDLILCSLTLHHFDDEQIVRVLSQLHAASRHSVLICDLARSRISYYLFAVFARFFLNTPTARADGLTSIRKGFRPKDFRNYQKHLKACTFRLRWVWAFRYHWLITKNQTS